MEAHLYDRPVVDPSLEALVDPLDVGDSMNRLGYPWVGHLYDALDHHDHRLRMVESLGSPLEDPYCLLEVLGYP